MGFSLIEIMLAVSLVSIILALAVPSYRQYAERSWRADAIGQLLTAAECQERVFARVGAYDTTRCTTGFNTSHYRFRFEPEASTSSTGFTVIAQPKSHSNDPCGTLGLDQAGTRSIGGSADMLRKCWEGR